jgi:hypothetical protein
VAWVVEVSPSYPYLLLDMSLPKGLFAMTSISQHQVAYCQSERYLMAAQIRGMYQLLHGALTEARQVLAEKQDLPSLCAVTQVSRMW